ncbi:MAG: hypothetical protein ABI680_00645, partial [Chthoniobacteraceae bacterium]
GESDESIPAMKTCLTAALALVALVVASLPANLEGADGKADPILGIWLWRGQVRVTITADGKAIGDNGFRGVWKYLNNREVERKYEMVWNEGVFTESLKLSQDGSRLEGKNQKGERLFARRAATKD